MRYLFAIPLFILLMQVTAFAEIKTKEVKYSSNSTNMKGYIAYDDSIKGKRPGVLVVHEWWGHNEYARKRANMLAELGYVALALDMYGDGKTADHPDNASKYMNDAFSNMDQAQARFEAALELLKKQPQTDSEQIAAIGYCFGGATVLQMARRGVDLDGVVSFHGLYATEEPAQEGKVKASILVCHGAEDPFVTQEQVDGLKKEMADAKVDFKFISYEGAKHSFTNPASTELGKKFELPLEYNAEADKQSWEAMQNFLKVIFEEDK